MADKIITIVQNVCGAAIGTACAVSTIAMFVMWCDQEQEIERLRSDLYDERRKKKPYLKYVD